MAPYAPSILLKNWEPNLPSRYIECDPSLKDSQEGYKYFCVVELQVISFEIVELNYDGHIRFTVDKKNKIKFLAS